MATFVDISNALAQISDFMATAGAGIPEVARVPLAASIGAISPVDRIVQFGRAVHEHRAELDADARAIGIAALSFAAQYGWHGLDSEAPALIAAIEAVG